LSRTAFIRYAQAPELFTDMANVRGWNSACQSLPAFTAMMAERNAEPL
jgi:hypothetical protein